jgi:hypothetical protein
MKRLLLPFLSSLILFSACGDKSTQAPPATNSHLFSFEDDMAGWETRGIDLELGDSLIVWAIHRTQEMAKEGSTAVEFYLENYNDAGKIWIQRPFEVSPDASYRVQVAYAFCSAEFGMAKLWTIITGVVPKQPETRDDLVYQGHTGNGSETDIGFQWLEKSYHFDVTASKDGQLYVFVGIWGTWETPRRYYLDSLAVSFAEKS